MRRSSQLLPGDIRRRIKLTSAVYNIQPFPQQGVGNVLPLRVDVGLWRRIVKEWRNSNGKRFGNLAGLSRQKVLGLSAEFDIWGTHP